MPRIAIVGAGQAGLQIAESVRRGGFVGEITLIGDEAWLPYQRPPLSKKYLQGDMARERLYFRPETFFATHSIDVRLATRVVGIDRVARRLSLSDATALSYDWLALATGARVRRLSVPGADDKRVHYLRGIDDAERLAGALQNAQRIAIVGGGFIGLEIAAVARALGKSVTVIEAQDRLMPRVVAPVVSTYFAALHRRQGVTILTDNQVRSFAPTLDEVVVQLEIGTPVSADLVVVGIGVVPNTEIAAAAGLVCEGGIVVDEFARTSDPSIVAAGDCTWHRNLMFERPHRLESVQNAVDQAKVAAATLLGTPAAYQQVPWFWSDQYDVKLQMAGISAGYDELVTRGDPETGAFSVFYYARGRVIAVDSVNRPAEHMLARRLLASGGQLAAAAAQDPAIDLKALVHANA